MSSEVFWKLSWYDWTLWVFRIEHLRTTKKQEREYQAELTRRVMQIVAKGSGVKHESGRDLETTDFFRLSYDTVPEAKPTLSAEETMKKVKERFKKYLKK